MRLSVWRLLGIVLGVLGVVFLVGSVTALAYGYGEYAILIAILIVFGWIFLILGVGLVMITFLEKEE